MAGFAILLGFNLLGLALHVLLHVPLPGNVLGLILFSVALWLRVVKLEWVEQSASLLLRHMLLFFTPVVVATMTFAPTIRREAGAIVGGLVAGTFAALLVAGWIARLGAGGRDNGGAS